jgi:hypothetical protein
MNHPKGFTVDDRGNIYVADAMNMAIRKISDTGNLKKSHYRAVHIFLQCMVPKHPTFTFCANFICLVMTFFWISLNHQKE